MKKPETIDELREFSRLMVRNPRRCLEIIEEWLANDPEDLSALYDRHAAWMGLGEHDKALADLDAVIARDPDSPWNFLARGNIHRQLGDYEQALVDYARGEALDPEDWQRHEIGLLFQATCHARLGNERAALSCCSRLSEDFWLPSVFGTPGGTRAQIAAGLSRLAEAAGIEGRSK